MREMQVETVKVKNPAEHGGYMIINRADLSEVHVLFEHPTDEPKIESKKSKTKEP